MSKAVEEDQSNAEQRRKDGEFVRGISTARNKIGDPGFEAEPGRYHLYVAFNCPWCHRVSLARALHGLEDSITMDVLFPNRTNDDHEKGANLWIFRPDGVETTTGRKVVLPECTVDTVMGTTVVKEVYETSGIMDQKSVPILFDKKRRVVVSNESAEIIRFVGEQAKALGGNNPRDMYPESLREKIDEVNEWVYTDINNGSYKCGFSSNQDVVDEAYRKYFSALERIEGMLSSHPRDSFLLGTEAPTEADLRLFPTIYRHDPVYMARMKLGYASIREYPFLWRWVCKMHSLPGVAAVSNLHHAKQGYYGRTGNNTIPPGPPGFPSPVYDTPAAATGEDGWASEPDKRAEELLAGLPRGWLSSFGGGK